jgi:hypothetical protein
MPNSPEFDPRAFHARFAGFVLDYLIPIFALGAVALLALFSLSLAGGQ